MSKDNTCPTCMGRGGWEFEPGEISPCGECGGSGQQEDKPTSQENFGQPRVLPPSPPQAPIPDGAMQDSKPEKPHDYKNNGLGAMTCQHCDHVMSNPDWPVSCPGRQKATAALPPLSGLKLAGSSAAIPEPSKSDQLIEKMVDDIVTHAYNHPPVPKAFYRARIQAFLATEYDRGKVEVFERMVKVYETYPGWKTIKKIMESKPVDADTLFSWIETMDTELAHEIGKLEDELKSKGESK